MVSGLRRGRGAGARERFAPPGSYDLPPQAGIAVFERGPDGLLAAARVYDDVEAPVVGFSNGADE